MFNSVQIGVVDLPVFITLKIMFLGDLFASTILTSRAPLQIFQSGDIGVVGNGKFI